MSTIDGPHWRFSLRLYGSEGVSEACLHLQDKHGVDVNVLLLALYAGLADGRRVSSSEIAALNDAVRDQREALVVPLRRIRRLLKDLPFGPGSEALRATVKKAELEAEQFEQMHLARVAAGFPHGASQDAAGLCALVLRHFDGEASTSGDPASALNIIARACGRLN